MNTVKLVKKIIAEITILEKAFNVFKKIFPVVYIAYLVFAIAVNPVDWLWYANIVLLVLTFASYVYDIFVDSKLDSLKGRKNKEAKKQYKTSKRLVKKIVKFIKRSIKVLILGSSLMQIFLNSAEIPPISIFITAFMVIVFAFELIFDLLISLLTKQVLILKETLKNDVQAPIEKVKEIYRKVTRKDGSSTDGETAKEKVTRIAGAIGDIFSKVRKKNADYIEVTAEDVTDIEDLEKLELPEENSEKEYEEV